MRRKTEQQGEPPKTILLVPRSEVKEKIQKQIEKGRKLLESSSGLDGVIRGEDVEGSTERWMKYNEELLGRIFDTDSFKQEHHRAVLNVYSELSGSTSVAGRRFGRAVPSKNKDEEMIKACIEALESIIERLELIPEPEEVKSSEPKDRTKIELGSDIFIVHGHDEACKESVARFIQKLELKPIILHEQPNQGRTIIEKFEDYSNVGFAIVLMTPDDVGSAIDDKENLKPRARQNVVFELGFFVGRLGRNCVCALYKGNVEIPSDYTGVLFIPMESEWKLSLAKEIKAAGIKVDLNKAI